MSLAVLTALTVSCSPTSHNDSPDIPPPTSQALGLRFPFDAYQLSDSELHVTYEGTDVLIGACMHKSGHTWKTVEIPHNVASWRNRLHFGVIEPEVAKIFGYHTPAELLESPKVRAASEAMKKRDTQLGESAAQAAGKCRDSADRKLTHDAMASFGKFNELKSTTFSAAENDPEVRRTMKAWGACMRKEGFNYATSSEADGAKKWYRNDNGKASKEEIATAEADVRCKGKTGLVTVWFAAEKRLEEQEIRENRSYFKNLKAANERYLSNARVLIPQN
ncbi:hypothetical protein [Streptomyces sp. NPDC048309]|uniref:hypothetical protein n=1 Tax=Streptomyces sp. NPDC048309 TaxID=3154618 RepID=UPI0033F81608